MFSRLTVTAVLSQFLWVAPAGAAPSVPECLAANEEAITLKNRGQLLAARSALLVCADAGCPAEVRRECARRMEDINEALPSIVFETKDASLADLAGVRVIVDGSPLQDHLEGAAIPLDPGPHSFRFEREGYTPVEMKYVLRQGEKSRRERVVLEAKVAPRAPSPPPTASASERVQQAAEQPEPKASPSISSTRIVGIALGSAGLIGLGASGYFGLKAKARYDDSNSGHCDASGCDDAGLELREQAFDAARLSTIFAAAGGALVAGGVVLFVMGGTKAEPASKTLAVAPRFHQRGGGLAIIGGF